MGFGLPMVDGDRSRDEGRERFERGFLRGDFLIFWFSLLHGMYGII